MLTWSSRLSPAGLAVAGRPRRREEAGTIARPRSPRRTRLTLCSRQRPQRRGAIRFPSLRPMPRWCRRSHIGRIEGHGRVRRRAVDVEFQRDDRAASGCDGARAEAQDDDADAAVRKLIAVGAESRCAGGGSHAAQREASGGDARVNCSPRTGSTRLSSTTATSTVVPGCAASCGSDRRVPASVSARATATQETRVSALKASRRTRMPFILYRLMWPDRSPLRDLPARRRLARCPARALPSNPPQETYCAGPLFASNTLKDAGPPTARRNRRRRWCRGAAR